MDWICSNEAFDEQIEIFLTIGLRQPHGTVEEGTAPIYHQNQRDPHPVVDYAVFLKALLANHDIQGQGLEHPEAISAKKVLGAMLHPHPRFERQLP